MIASIACSGAGAGLDEALERLGRDLCPPAYDHLRQYRRGLEGLGARIQRSRVVVLASSAKNR